MFYRVILFCILAVSAVLAVEPANEGVQIFRREHEPVWQGYIAIPGAGNIDLPNRFSAEFEVKFANSLYFGYIFSISAPENELLLLTFNQHPNPDSVIIRMSVNGQPEYLEVSIAESLCDGNSWLPIRIELDRDQQTARLMIADYPSKTMHTVAFRFHAAQFSFGRLPFQIESPTMLVRELRLYDANTLTGYWPFSSDLNDRISGKAARLNDAVLINDARMQPQHIYTIPEKINHLPYLYTMPGNDTLYIASGYRLMALDRFGFRYYMQDLSHPCSEQYRFEPLFDFVNNRILAVFDRHGQVARLERSSGKWSDVDTVRHLSHYNHLVKIIDPADGSIYGFGGYGFYRIHNELLKYNFTQAVWDTIDLNPAIPPRYYCAASQLSENRYYYIGGGIGNASGRQSDGFYPYHDLWRFDSQTKIFELITDNIPVPENFIFQIGDFNEADSSFYFAGTSLAEHSIRSGQYRFFRYYLPGGTLTELPFTRPLSMLTDILSLRLHASTLYFLVRETKVAVEKTASKPSIQSSTNYLYRVLLSNPAEPVVTEPVVNTEVVLGLLLLFVVPGSLMLLRKKRRKGQAVSAVFSKKESILHISLFGTFTLRDDNDQLADKKTSRKLQEIFAWLLLYAPDSQNAVTTARLTEIFWPELEPTSAKNARGTALYRLRQWLSGIPEIELENGQRNWWLNIHKNVKIDFVIYQADTKALNASSDLISETPVILRWIQTIKAGTFLENIDSPWAENYRAQLTAEIDQTGNYILEYLFQNGDYPLAEKTAHAVLQWNPVSEPAAARLIRILIDQKRSREAFSQFEAFKRDYEDLFAKPFDHSLEEFAATTGS